tara:strand:+ start:271 stop:489 length:219 start_codon:yes stop_codon:yes gene_type:complete
MHVCDPTSYENRCSEGRIQLKQAVSDGGKRKKNTGIAVINKLKDIVLLETVVSMGKDDTSEGGDGDDRSRQQ